MMIDTLLSLSFAQVISIYQLNYCFLCLLKFVRCLENIKYCIKLFIMSRGTILPIYYILISNVINNLVPKLRQLELRSLGVEMAEEYSEPCQTTLSLTILGRSSIFNVW